MLDHKGASTACGSPSSSRSDAPGDLIVALSVYQEFAKRYGTPELYTGP